jgi:thymidylate synthase ThyX
MSHRTSAQVILDSITPYGENTRLTSIYVVFPKFVLAERNRHRGFSLSDRSSRAVPPEKLIEEVRTDPAMPAKFRKRAKGMGGGEELDGDHLANAQANWHKAALYVCEYAEHSVDLAKEIANRPLDPFIRMHSLMTATRDVWLNFFGLRLDSGADPTIQVLAQKCFEAYKASAPTLLQPGEWHLPFVDETEDEIVSQEPLLSGARAGDFIDWGKATLGIKRRLSAARCAHLSYNDLETGKRMTIERALSIYDKIVGSRPIHASPCEHQACVGEIDAYTIDFTEPIEEQKAKRELPTLIELRMKHPNQHGNFAAGWRQARKMLPNEAVAPLPEGYEL